MRRCLIVVDYQNDFVSKNGALYDGGYAENIEESLFDKVSEFTDNKDDVIFTLDNHSAEDWNFHPESKNYKIHCEKNQNGSYLYGKLALFQDTLKSPNFTFIKKDSFAMDFYNIKNIVEKYDNITLSGIVSHICVFQNAVCLYNCAVESRKNIVFNIFEKGCASFDFDAQKYTFWYLKNILGFNEIK